LSRAWLIFFFDPYWVAKCCKHGWWVAASQPWTNPRSQLNFSPWQVVGSFNVFWMEQFVDHPKTGVKNWRQIATVPFLKHSTAVYGTLSSALGLLRAVEMPSAASAGEPWHETETRVP
jgi:hypothetical protein